MFDKRYWRKEATKTIKSIAQRAEQEYRSGGSKWIVKFDKDDWTVIVLYDESLTQQQINGIEQRVNAFIIKRDIEYHMKIVYGVLKKIVKIPTEIIKEELDRIIPPISHGLEIGSPECQKMQDDRLSKQKYKKE